MVKPGDPVTVVTMRGVLARTTVWSCGDLHFVSNKPSFRYEHSYEGTWWIAGRHSEDSAAGRALLAANALVALW